MQCGTDCSLEVVSADGVASQGKRGSVVVIPVQLDKVVMLAFAGHQVCHTGWAGSLQRAVQAFQSTS